jgi:hypothetical protein
MSRTLSEGAGCLSAYQPEELKFNTNFFDPNSTDVFLQLTNCIALAALINKKFTVRPGERVLALVCGGKHASAKKLRKEPRASARQGFRSQLPFFISFL